MDNRNQRRPIKSVEFEQHEQNMKTVKLEEQKKSRQIHAQTVDQEENKEFSLSNAKKQKRLLNWKKKESIYNNPWKSVIQQISQTAIVVVSSLLIVTILGIIAYNYTYRHFVAPVDKNSTEEIDVIIDKDDSLNTISKKLEEAGIIRNSTIFKYYVDFSDMSSKLLAGKFTLSPSMTYDDIINVLKRPSAAQTSTRLMFVEGSLIKEMATKLVDGGVLSDSIEFVNDTVSGEDYSNYWFIQEVLDKESTQQEHRDYILEGYLFPDTYEFFFSTEADVVIKKMLDRFNEIYTEEFRTRAEELGMTTDEVVTLASIIEKEAGKVEDFSKVSAVFHNRLNQDMTLGSCATLQYFMPVKKYVYTYEETRTPSPYNTYINKGLPIGPICNPGKAAIEAALWPDEQFMKDGYLYFCAGDPAEGTTVFAKTYEEHQANIKKYESLW